MGIKMKKIMITGCNGQLGRALNQLYGKEQEIEIINTDVFQGQGRSILRMSMRCSPLSGR